MQTTSVLCYPSWWLNAKPMSLKNCASPPPPRKTPYEVITLKQAHQTLFRLSSCSVCFCLMLWHVFGETWCAFPLLCFYMSPRLRDMCGYICFLYIYMVNDKKKKTNRNKEVNMFMPWMSFNLVCCMPQSGWSGWETFIPTCLFDPPCLTSFVPPLKWKVPDEAKMFFTMFRCFSFQWNVRLWPLWNAFDVKCMNGKEENTWKGRWTNTACGNWILNPSSPMDKKSGAWPVKMQFHVILVIWCFSVCELCLFCVWVFISFGVRRCAVKVRDAWRVILCLWAFAPCAVLTSVSGPLVNFKTVVTQRVITV